jgi:hypothetical protein
MQFLIQTGKKRRRKKVKKKPNIIAIAFAVLFIANFAVYASVNAMLIRADILIEDKTIAGYTEAKFMLSEAKNMINTMPSIGTDNENLVNRISSLLDERKREVLANKTDKEWVQMFANNGDREAAELIKNWGKGK